MTKIRMTSAEIVAAASMHGFPFSEELMATLAVGESTPDPNEGMRSLLAHGWLTLSEDGSSQMDTRVGQVLEVLLAPERAFQVLRSQPDGAIGTGRLLVRGSSVLIYRLVIPGVHELSESDLSVAELILDLLDESKRDVGEEQVVVMELSSDAAISGLAWTRDSSGYQLLEPGADGKTVSVDRDTLEADLMALIG